MTSASPPCQGRWPSNRQIAFGALQAGLDIEYSLSSVDFTEEGFDEIDQVSGDGSAELLDEGSTETKFAPHNGDEAVLKSQTGYFVNNLLDVMFAG